MDLKELDTIIRLISQDKTQKAIDELWHLVEENNYNIDYQEIHTFLTKKSAEYRELKNEIFVSIESKVDEPGEIAGIIRGIARLTHEIKRKIEAGSSAVSGHEKRQNPAEIEKQKFKNPKLPIVNIGTIGHLDHGKTTLTAAILYVLSINGFFNEIEDDPIAAARAKIECGGPNPADLIPVLEAYQDPNRNYSHIDYPADVEYLKKAMMTGVVQMDGAILVVAATDGLTHQTKEYIQLAHKVGVPSIVVFLNKVDLVDDEKTLEGFEREVRQLLNQYEFNGDEVSIIKGSALKALQGDADAQQAIKDLIEACYTDIRPLPLTLQPFLMPIEDAFTITGHGGPMVTGLIERGVIETDDEVEIIGMRKEGDKPPRPTVIGIEMFRKILTRGKAGDNAGIILQGIDENEIKRGMVICTPGSVKAHKHFKCEVYVLGKYEGGRHTPFFNGYRAQFYFRNIYVTGEVSLPEGVEMVMPGGDIVSLEVKLVNAIALEKGLRFAFREDGYTVGSGRVTGIIE